MTGPFHDIHGRHPPRWLLRSFSDALCSHRSADTLVTRAQYYQLIGLDSTSAAIDAHGLRQSAVCVERFANDAEAHAVLTHGRLLRRVSPTNGDVPLHFDFSEFLSVTGSSLTNLPAELRRLEERSQARLYQLPFWLTQVQLTNYFGQRSLQHDLAYGLSSVATTDALYQDPSVFVELSCTTGTPARVVNLDEFKLGRDTALSLFRLLSYLRVFSPINVRTMCGFDEVVECRLRVECQRSGCWCSVWGSAKDYASRGFAVLPGALGVDVFDKLGNPHFLIHALCTTTPADVFATCYPSDSISFRGVA